MKLSLGVLFSVLMGSTAMKGDTSMELPPGSIRRLYEFGFLPGGSILANWTLLPPYPKDDDRSVVLGLCTPAQVTAILTYYDDPWHSLCHMVVTNICWKVSKVWGPGDGPNSTTNLVWSVGPTVPPAGDLSLVTINCYRGGQATVALHYEAVNPGGEQLSSGEIPLKPLSLAFIALWAGLALLMVVGGAAAHARYTPPDPSELQGMGAALSLVKSPVREIHVVMVVCALASSASAALSWTVWTRVSREGVVDIGSAVGDTGLWDTASAMVVMLLLAISRGWQITRPGLDKLETRAMASLTALYALAWSVWQYIGGFFALFCLVLTYMLILRYLFHSLTYSLRVLGIFRAYSASLMAAAASGLGRSRSSSGGSGSGRAAESQPLIPREASTAGAAAVVDSRPLPASALQVDEATARLLAAPAYGGLYAAHTAAGSPSASGTATGSGDAWSARGKAHSGTRLEEEGQGGGGYQSSGTAIELATLSPRQGGGGSGYGAFDGDNTDAGIGPGRPAAPTSSTTISSALGRAASLVSSWAWTALDFFSGTDSRREEEQEEEDAERQQRQYAGRGPVREGGLALRQLRLLRLLRSFVVLYLAIDVLANVWATMDWGQEPWVEFLVEHVMSMVLLGCLGWALRPRADPSRSPLFDPRGYVGAQDGVLQPLVGAHVVGAPGRGKGSAGPRDPSKPRWLVVMGPDGEVHGAAGKADEAPLTVPVLPPDRWLADHQAARAAAQASAQWEVELEAVELFGGPAGRQR